jgi:hypothetical protein
MMPRPETPTRYGCQEFREDSELVLGGRAQPGLVSMYQAHRQSCSDCMRFHRVLRATYEGPQFAAAPDRAQRTREFAEVLRRVDEERPRPWYLRLAAPVGITALSATAAALAVSLFAPSNLVPMPLSSQVASLGDDTHVQTSEIRIPLQEDQGGIEHQAQSFGRVVAGTGVLTDDDANLVTADTFSTGTHFRVVGPDSLQLGLVGKILANIEPGSRGHWDTASPGLIELTLDRGMLAMRYERREADPILEVHTPSAVVRVTGTVFTVAVDAQGSAVVSVLRGEVEVLEPGTRRLLADVEAGYRFDVASSSYGDVGRAEVAAALSLSMEYELDGTLHADGQIPESWAVPGLVASGDMRRLDQVISALPPSQGEDELMLDGDTLDRRKLRRRRPVDEGDDLLESLIEETQRARQAKLTADLQRCRELYASAETRFRAASCLTSFMRKYGDEPGAVEGLLLIGILRMDFAHDYQAANLYFEEFLRRAPDHPKAELAMYKRWLASTESGKIPEALTRGKQYLQRYAHGQYVGRILARFPELKDAL